MKISTFNVQNNYRSYNEDKSKDICNYLMNNDIDILCNFLGNGISRIIQIIETILIYFYFLSQNIYIFSITLITSILMILLLIMNIVMTIKIIIIIAKIMIIINSKKIIIKCI